MKSAIFEYLAADVGSALHEENVGRRGVGTHTLLKLFKTFLPAKRKRKVDLQQR